MRSLRSIRGFTILENLVALSILAIIFFSMTLAYTNIFKVEAQTSTVVNRQQMVAMIIESIKADPASYQKNYSAATSDNMNVLVPANLPLGYQGQYFGPKSGCPPQQGCAGLVGFTLIPYESYKGLFMGTVYIYDIAKQQGDSYNFLVNSY